MNIKTLITLLALNVAFIGIAVLLIFRKIPRNHFYGFRLPSAMTDDAIWYDVNGYFGLGFLKASVFSSVAILLLFGYGSLPADVFKNSGLLLMVLPQTVVVLMTIRYTRMVKRRYQTEDEERNLLSTQETTNKKP